MSTNAVIMKRIDEKIVKAIYLHWDGYTDHALTILQNNYHTEELVDELLALGDCSSIDTNLEESVFYHRDRDEKWESVKPSEGTLAEMKRFFGDVEYKYIFENGEWLNGTFCIK